MAGIDRKKSVSLLETIIRNSSLSEGHLAGYDAALFGVEDNRLFGLNEEGKMALDEILDTLSDEPTIRGKVGDRRLLLTLISHLAALRGMEEINRDDVWSLTKSVISEAKSAIRQWEAYVPVDGLVLQCVPELVVGKVKLHTFEAISDSLRQRIGSVSYGDENTGLRCRLQTVFQGEFSKSRLIAEVDIECDDEMAPQIVDSEVSYSLSLLNCFAYHYGEIRPGLGLTGSVAGGVRHYVFFYKSGDNLLFGSSGIGAFHPFSWSKQDLDRLEGDERYRMLKRILADNNLNGYGKLLKTAIYWVGQGLVSVQPQDRIVHFAVALETLMTAGRQEDQLGSITERIGRRVAYLLSADPQTRHRLYRRTKELYGLRSKVVHTGLLNIRSRDLDELRSTTLHALFAMADRSKEWTTHDQFTDWVTEQEFPSGMASSAVHDVMMVTTTKESD